MLDMIITSVISAIVINLISYKVQQCDKNKGEIKSLKLALKTELQTLQAIYYQLKISDNPPKNGDDIKVISLQSQYTTVYERNAGRIGMLEPDVAEAVVTAYVYVDAFMDTLRVYGQRWEAMIAYERAGKKTYWEYYRSDINRCFLSIHESQEKTREVISRAIDKLS